MWFEDVAYHVGIPDCHVDGASAGVAEAGDSSPGGKGLMEVGVW